jgi:diguanylate cyclase (GGDEF)-like protein
VHAPPPKPWRAIAAGLAAVAIIGALDYVSGHELRLFPLYFLPIGHVAWRLPRSGGAVAFAVLSAGTWFLSNWLAGKIYSNPLIWTVNFTSQLIAFAVVGYLVAELRRRLLAEQSLSRRDPLTALPNSRAFYERSELLLAIARRSKRPVTLAYLDLDHFKQVNDERGHHEGDRVLIEIAEALRTQLRDSDLPARLGGDEFAILLSDTDTEAAEATLERVRSDICVRMRPYGWPVTVSIGAIAYLRAPDSLSEAMRDADDLMYRAKQSGKDRLSIEVVAPGGWFRKPASHDERKVSRPVVVAPPRRVSNDG